MCINYNDLITRNFSIDSRTIQPGEVFCALKGFNTDGNLFIEEAISKNASYVISEKKINHTKCIFVENVIDFLQKLATYKRSKLTGKIICITGSVGKTTTKETIFKILSPNYKTFKTPQNFNNQIGLPLSILNTPLDIDFAIYELGISSMGEMSLLTQIARPNIAIITNVGNTHIEFLHSMTNIAKEKIKIIEGMTGGYLLFTEHSPFTAYFKKICLSKNINFIPFQETPYRELLGLLKIELDDNTLENSRQYIPGRGKVYELKNNITLIDHSYNSCLESIRFCAKELSAYKTKRKIMILGDMLALGENVRQEHLKILPILDKYLIDKVYLCGDSMQEVFHLINEDKRGDWFPTVQELLEKFPFFLISGDTVTIKASHDIKFSLLIDKLYKQNLI